MIVTIHVYITKQIEWEEKNPPESRPFVEPLLPINAAAARGGGGEVVEEGAGAQIAALPKREKKGRDGRGVAGPEDDIATEDATVCLIFLSLATH